MEPLKDRYDEIYISAMIRMFSMLYPAFPGERFHALIYDDQWDGRELKERMGHIAECLHATLPENYREALAILEKAAPSLGGFEGMFVPQFVASYGMDDWDASLPALAHFTQFGSSEFAIRPFILADPQRVMELMLRWASHENYHVRRLASEGCRPRLPWAMALPDFKKDPSLIFPILEQLRDDPEEYVRRSVANNLNDISKDHPGLILDLTEKWLGANKNRDKLLKHACRTLLKAGDERAMALFGFGKPEGVTVSTPSFAQDQIAIGENLHFSFVIHCAQSVHLRLEYAVIYAKAKGKRSRKVFKISERDYPEGETSIQRKQAFRDLTTRKHYPGEHGLEILVNGHTMAETPFQVTVQH